MRRVIQRTITTTRIVSLTITHSESEEAVEYTVIDDGGADHFEPSTEYAMLPLAPADEEPATPDDPAAPEAG